MRYIKLHENEKVPVFKNVIYALRLVCKADKRQECRKNQKSFHRVSSSEDIL